MEHFCFNTLIYKYFEELIIVLLRSKLFFKMNKMKISIFFSVNFMSYRTHMHSALETPSSSNGTTAWLKNDTPVDLTVRPRQVKRTKLLSNQHSVAQHSDGSGVSTDKGMACRSMHHHHYYHHQHHHPDPMYKVKFFHQKTSWCTKIASKIWLPVMAKISHESKIDGWSRFAEQSNCFPKINSINKNSISYTSFVFTLCVSHYFFIWMTNYQQIGFAPNSKNFCLVRKAGKKIYTTRRTNCIFLLLLSVTFIYLFRHLSLQTSLTLTLEIISINSQLKLFPF